jgi:type II secretory pathway component PulF
MSDSIKKYHELLEEGKTLSTTLNQTSTMTIIEVLRASDCAGNLKLLLEKATEICKKGPNLTPATVFQIAGEEVKVDESCTPEKQQQWNNQE